MVYQLIDPDRFIQGLPMMPLLDETTLNEEGRKLLEQAVKIGIYAPQIAKKKKFDEKQEETA